MAGDWSKWGSASPRPGGAPQPLLGRSVATATGDVEAEVSGRPWTRKYEQQPCHTDADHRDPPAQRDLGNQNGANSESKMDPAPKAGAIEDRTGKEAPLAAASAAGCNTAILADGGATAQHRRRGLGMVWGFGLARRVMSSQAGLNEDEYEDQDPWTRSAGTASTTGSTTPTPSSTSGGVKERVLKMNTLVDQSHNPELLPPKSCDVSAWTGNYVAIMGAMPEESEEPTPSQLAALFKPVITNDQAPYDFGVWCPYGSCPRCRNAGSMCPSAMGPTSAWVASGSRGTPAGAFEAAVMSALQG